MKIKGKLVKLLACVLVMCMCLTALPPVSVFAESKAATEEIKEEQCELSDVEMKLPNTKGDLILEELQVATLLEEDVPEYISQAEIDEKGHVHRLREQEPGRQGTVPCLADYIWERVQNE